MHTAKLFLNGSSQSVRLPKDYRFEGSEVLIKKIGNVVVLSPVDKKWSSFFKSLEQFPEDFLLDRKQPPIQERK